MTPELALNTLVAAIALFVGMFIGFLLGVVGHILVHPETVGSEGG